MSDRSDDRANDRKDDRNEREQAFFSVPVSAWSSVGPEERADLRALAATIARVVDDGEGPLPNELAMQLMEAANRLFGAVAREESDLRQVISTLRTAMAVCWDMYSADETGRVSVFQHMQHLRETIEDFERDLRAFQQGRI